MGAYTGAARHRAHLVTVLLRPPSGHRPGKRRARSAHILQIGIHLTQPWSLWTPPRHDLALRISTEKNPMGGIRRMESLHMPIDQISQPNYIQLTRISLHIGEDTCLQFLSCLQSKSVPIISIKDSQSLENQNDFWIIHDAFFSSKQIPKFSDSDNSNSLGFSSSGSKRKWGIL